MDVDVSAFASNLSKAVEGYWTTPTQTRVSYPENGNETCYSVEERSFWFRHRNGVITDVVRRFPPGGTLFDIGGGNGFVAKGLEASGISTVVVEPGHIGASNALRRGLRNVICSTVECIDFRNQSMAAAGMFDVLEHIEDEQRILKRLHSLIRPDGRLFITVPAFQWLWSNDDELAGHQRRYTTGSLSRALRSSGFMPEYVSYFFWFLPIPVLLFRTVPSLLGLARREGAHSASSDAHSIEAGFVNRIVGALQDVERRRILTGKTMPLGGSCLAVARRP